MAIQTQLLCPHCGMISPIWRKGGKQKEMGHLKKLYCYRCQTTHNHIELKDAMHVKGMSLQLTLNFGGDDNA